MRLLAFTLLVPILGFTHGWFTHPQPPNKPPKITCPNTRTLYTADRKSTTTVVTWSKPRASDPEGRYVTVSLRSGKRSGSVFGRGQHAVVYEAKDNKGLKDTCMFTFTVHVIQCRMLSCIRNGRVSCEGRNYGHTCNFYCEMGYRLVGSKNIQCMRSGQWNHQIPKCVAKECSVLIRPPYSLGYMCTNGRRAGSVCMLRCDETKGYALERGEFTKCSYHQTWTNLRLKCQDVEAPQIHNCPTQTLVISKDHDSAQTYVKWAKPLTVTDNSGDELEVEAIGGQASAEGGFFEEGVNLVRFRARDRAGNTSPLCAFNVRIQTVRCDPPKMDDPHLETPDCVDFREGQSCYLQCYLALQRVGPLVITCKKDNSSSQLSKGYWSYGQNESPPAEKPYCRVHNCTQLRAPKFGAISCDKWELGRTCSISCRDGYDIPESVAPPPDYYTCKYSTGRWNSDYVPDCTWRPPGEKIRMMGYYYFTGSCLDSREIIKENFLTVINDRHACPSDKYCTVENVNVRCGDEPEEDEWWRRKRSLR